MLPGTSPLPATGTREHPRQQRCGRRCRGPDSRENGRPVLRTSALMPARRSASLSTATTRSSGGVSCRVENGGLRQGIVQQGSVEEALSRLSSWPTAPSCRPLQLPRFPKVPQASRPMARRQRGRIGAGLALPTGRPQQKPRERHSRGCIATEELKGCPVCSCSVLAPGPCP